ncbi:MAG: SDR family oxidoreductase [Deltaproteobacteria bacterium]|nr:SDR family oxidoreductase [Deltaproteobacteria bacterium]
MGHEANARTVLVTGYPLDAARRLARELTSIGDRVLLLARDKFAVQARELAADLSQSGPGKAEVLEGDILALDLGLSGAEVRRLHEEVEEVHHLAAIHYLGIEAPRMRQVNVEGLRETLELALGMKKLRRVCVWSTVFVAGNRTGSVHEHELMVGQAFRNPYERTKAEAELLARAAMAKLPVTVVRVPILVGDSRTGEAGRLEGVYALASQIAQSDQAIVLPITGTHSLHIAPVDYAVQAAVHLARLPQTEGGTFHLVDEQPMTARAFFDAVADAAGRPRPLVSWQGRVHAMLRKVPAVSGQVRHERSFLEWFDCEVRFDATQTRLALAGSGITCPRVAEYVDALVQWLRERDDGLNSAPANAVASGSGRW